MDPSERRVMSLAGPCPSVPSKVALYGKTNGLVSDPHPGMTGLWQISGRSDVCRELRLRFDTAYVRNCTIWRELAILMRTISAKILPDAH